MRKRGDITAAQREKAVCGNEISQTVDQKNACKTDVIVDKTNKRASEKHAGLHANKHRGIRAGELARRDYFLDERVDIGPVHRGARASDQGHEVEVPKLQMTMPCDVRDRDNRKTTGEVEDHAEVAAVIVIDKPSTEKRDDESRKRNHDNLPADSDSGMRDRHDVPADTDEVHAAAEEGHKHGREKETE